MEGRGTYRREGPKIQRNDPCPCGSGKKYKKCCDSPLTKEALDLAVRHHQAGQLPNAEKIYRQILDVNPNHADALHLLGVIAFQVGKHPEAIDLIGRAIAVKPQAEAYHSNLGNALKEQGKLDEAVASYVRALQIKPDFTEAHNNLGIALYEQGKLEDAVASYVRALQIKPDYAEAHYNLGNALNEQGKFDEAVASYQRALQIKPDYAEAHNNLGSALTEQGEFDEAVASYQRALQIKPDFTEAHYNLGTALRVQGKLDEAVACYQRALQIKPDYAEAHQNLGMSYLLTGNFEDGWSEYEWRWKTDNELFRPRSFSQPLWDGRPLEDQTILLHPEQGLGDSLQFIRYSCFFKELDARVVFRCDQSLLRLLKSCQGIDQLVAPGDELPPFDVHASLMSLPRLFDTTLETIPATIPYLVADEELVADWRRRLDRFDAVKIGVTWQGNPRFKLDRFRSIPLIQFSPLTKLENVQLFSVQIGTGRQELTSIHDGLGIVDLADDIHDFMDTAAILMNLDLVISIDTAVAHLAGALGVPVWVALTFTAEWRWLLGRDDSPWYPTMRLFRQSKLGDWEGVFERIETALQNEKFRPAY